MRYAFVHEEKANFPVIVLCRCMAVSASGYYDWVGRGPSKRSREDQELLDKLRANHGAHKRRYGARRHRKELARAGKRVGRNRVRRLMREGGLKARRRRPYKVTTNSNHQHPVAPNHLNRNFNPSGPNQAWVGDITYLPTADGWLYLAVVIDLYSRRVVGWSLSKRLKRDLVLRALRLAVGRRDAQAGLVFHCDRGSQYASGDYQRALKARGFVCSMSRRGDCWDNAVAESFFATLDTELMDDLVGAGRETVGHAVFEYIERYYNRRRLHSTLGYQTPVEYESHATTTLQTAAEEARAA